MYKNGCATLISIILLFSSPAYSAVPNNTDNLLNRPDIDTYEIPDYEKQEKVFELPELPPVPEGKDDIGKAVAGIFVKHYQFTGNTVFTDEELDHITAPYVNRIVYVEELHKLRQLLTLHYINAGYINSGVILADQKIKDGIIVFTVIEGRLSEIIITGTERYSDNFIAKRINQYTKTPLNVNSVHEGLLLLKQDPLIDQVKAEMAPGIQAGDALLNVSLKEHSPFRYSTSIDNHRSPSIGELRGELSGKFSNMTGWGDTLALSYTGTDGMDGYTLSYQIPVNTVGTTLALYHGKSDSLVIEEPFDTIDIENQTTTSSLEIAHPFYLTSRNKFQMGLRFQHKNTKTYLAGQPFSFTAGVVDGVSRVTDVQFFQEWLYRTRSQVVVIRNTVSKGLDMLDATIHNDDQPDSQFLKWNGLFYAAQRMDDAQIILRGGFQWADDQLLSSEKSTIGGAFTVRGYRENQLVEEKTAYLSLEYRMPFPWQSEYTRGLTIAPFIDYGGARRIDGTTPSPNTLSSVGFGLLYSNQHINASLYVAKALRDVNSNNSGDELQDRGIHFSVKYNY